MQLRRGGAQAMIGQGGQSRRITSSIRKRPEQTTCTGTQQIRNQAGQFDMGFF
jgi:hypothetical protein